MTSSVFFQKPLPNEKKSGAKVKRATKAKKNMKSTSAIVGQKKRDDNRKSAQQLARHVSTVLKHKKSSVESINQAIDSVRRLFGRMQMLKIEQLNATAAKITVKNRR